MSIAVETKHNIFYKASYWQGLGPSLIKLIPSSEFKYSIDHPEVLNDKFQNYLRNILWQFFSDSKPPSMSHLIK